MNWKDYLKPDEADSVSNADMVIATMVKFKRKVRDRCRQRGIREARREAENA